MKIIDWANFTEQKRKANTPTVAQTNIDVVDGQRAPCVTACFDFVAKLKMMNTYICARITGITLSACFWKPVPFHPVKTIAATAEPRAAERHTSIHKAAVAVYPLEQ
jgi:hypothetical protein